MNEDVLRTRLELLGAGPSPTADWADARGRAEGLRRRRNRLTIAAAVLAAVVVGAPTFAIATGGIDFWSAEPAPEPWKKVFAKLDRASAGGPGSMHGAPFKEARKVVSRQVGGKRVTLYVAPKEGGGFCLYLLEDLVPGGGGGAGSCVEAGNPLIRAGQLLASKRPRPVYGSTAAEGARQFEVTLADGTSLRTDVVWVSAPIEAGLYLIELPAGPAAQSFVVRDADGRELARRGLP